eukprot:c9319_g1_i1.p2 GENE.c9319_g1_i1~~c9319_g1_i1.p2  ORF type:complete len:120 (-),score=13.29 c9319_g1_i1:88-447(-)
MNWDIKDCEIDLIGTVPSSKLLLIGSCKRSASKVSPKNLSGHWEHLKNHWHISEGLHAPLYAPEVLENDWRVILVHFVAEDPSSEVCKQVEAAGQYLFSLRDLLQCFLLRWLLLNHSNP